jgi:hypothetical protein
MEPNPYSPPRAPVADISSDPVMANRDVLIACKLFWVMFGLTLAGTVFEVLRQLAISPMDRRECPLSPEHFGPANNRKWPVRDGRVQVSVVKLIGDGWSVVPTSGLPRQGGFAWSAGTAVRALEDRRS